MPLPSPTTNYHDTFTNSDAISTSEINERFGTVDGQLTLLTTGGGITSLNVGAFTATGIVSGSVTKTTAISAMELQAESGVTDDLDTIASPVNGDILWLTADAGDTITIKHNTGNIYLSGEADFSLSENRTICLFYNSAKTKWHDVTTGIDPDDLVDKNTCGFRLDCNGTQTTLLFSQITGLEIALPVTDATVDANWDLYQAPASLALSGLSASTLYHLYAYVSSGAIAWEWSTTAPTGGSGANYPPIKTGNALRRYVGTVYTTTNANEVQSDDGVRNCFSYYHQRPKKLYVAESTDSWSYTTAAWRSLNNSTANRVVWTQGYTGNTTQSPAVFLQATFAGSGGTWAAGLAIDATGTPSGQYPSTAYNNNTDLHSGVYTYFDEDLAIGNHFAQMVEYGGSGVTMYGDNGLTQMLQSGIIGYVWG